MRFRRIALTLTFVMAAVLSVACGRGEYAARAVNEETDRCAHCNMAVADDAHATQIVTKDGRTLIFDDIGCMFAWMAEHGDGEVGQAFVRDYHELGWIKLEKGYYVYDASFRTPMAYGVLSFASKSDAEAFIAEQGKGLLMTADDLSGHSWERNRDMMNGADGHHHGADGAMHEGEGAHGMDGGGHDSGHGDGAMDDRTGHDGGAAHEADAGHGGMNAQDAGHEAQDGDDGDAHAAGHEAPVDGHDGDDAHSAGLDGMNARNGADMAAGAVSAA